MFFVACVLGAAPGEEDRPHVVLPQNRDPFLVRRRRVDPAHEQLADPLRTRHRPVRRCRHSRRAVPGRFAGCGRFGRCRRGIHTGQTRRRQGQRQERYGPGGVRSRLAVRGLSRSHAEPLPADRPPASCAGSPITTLKATSIPRISPWVEEVEEPSASAPSGCDSSPGSRPTRPIPCQPAVGQDSPASRAAGHQAVVRGHAAPYPVMGGPSSNQDEPGEDQLPDG